MKTLLVAVILVSFCGVGLAAENIPRTHKFQLWGTLDNENDKLNFFLGFTNGLVASGVTVLECNGNQPAKRPMYECVLFSKDLDLEQAIAMIDKYYKENPEKWGDPIGNAIINALTVKGGPCGEAATKK
jgi:hypothetical protein